MYQECSVDLSLFFIGEDIMTEETIISLRKLIAYMVLCWLIIGLIVMALYFANETTEAVESFNSVCFEYCDNNAEH